jgi:hypothetical protein
MKDYVVKQRSFAKCALIRDLATDAAKREVFDRLASHLTMLSDKG